MIEGFQGDDLSSPNSVAATAKHFAGYAFGKRGGEYKEADIGPKKFHRTCLPPFKAAAEAGVAGYMIGFHTIDGIPATCHEELGELLADNWRHDGLVATDYTAVMELINHGVAADLKEAVYAAFKYGRVNLDLVSEGIDAHLKELVDEGRITEEEVTERCRQVLGVKVRLFWDESKNSWDALRYMPEKHLYFEGKLPEESRKLAREAVHETAVLLKNDSVLPLKKDGNKIALIGPLAGGEEARRSMQGTWAVSAVPTDSVTVLEGLQAMAGKDTEIHYAKGSNIEDNPNIAARLDVHNFNIPTASIDPRSPDEMIDEALAAARKSDVIVLCLGEAKEHTGESSSRSNVDLPECQMTLLRAIRAEARWTGKKLVVVPMSGRVMAMGDLEPMADAILYPGFAGTESGNGLADILYGDANPSGKMTMSTLRVTGQAPMTHEELPTGRPKEGVGNTVRGDHEVVRNVHGREVREVINDNELRNEALNNGSVSAAFRKFTTAADLEQPDSPIYPFGYGLSYTSFEYGPVKVNKNDLMGKNDLLKVSVKIRNTGDVAGKEVVQVYKHQPAGAGRKMVSHPKIELIDFAKVELRPGEEKTVSFEIPRTKLQWINARTISDYEEIFEPGDFEIKVGPNAGTLQTVRVTWNDLPKLACVPMLSLVA
jgi:beta-glucosidase